jgi:REP element-mobilizing transposase RayT
MRARAGLPSLRGRDVYAAIERAIGAAAVRTDCRVVHFSVQEDHLHVLLEAHDGRALSAGARGLAIRLARAVNRVLGRRGAVWDGRYHRHDLRTPREVRLALRYVLNNARKHGRVSIGLDRCSSARWFDGWRDAPRVAPSGPPVVQPPRTWLMTTGWRRAGGLLSVHEVPGRDPARLRFTFVEL